LRVSGNAVDILGDANRFKPEQHVLSNATYAGTRNANSALMVQYGMPQIESTRAGTAKSQLRDERKSESATDEHR